MKNIKKMVTYFNKKDLVSFGNYLLSDKRRELFYLSLSDNAVPPEERMQQVSHADIENWKCIVKGEMPDR